MTGERLPAIAPEHYSAAQRDAAAEFEALRGRTVFGPFEAMLHSPKLMSLAQIMGEYLRYHSGVGTTLSELAILIVARHWSQDYEWHVHAPIAAKAGISAEIIAAIRDGRRPDAMSADEAIIHDLSSELLQTRRVSDATWARAEQRFGKAGVVDLVGLNGYYSLLAMQLNAARFKLPPDAVPLPRIPD